MFVHKSWQIRLSTKIVDYSEYSTHVYASTYRPGLIILSSDQCWSWGAKFSSAHLEPSFAFITLYSDCLHSNRSPVAWIDRGSLISLVNIQELRSCALIYKLVVCGRIIKKTSSSSQLILDVVWTLHFLSELSLWFYSPQNALDCSDHRNIAPKSLALVGYCYLII